ncbi:MAG: glycerate kinase [Proteobacteria bacterium]|nr:MAG: glycerate kinase [Pseudomonadota bacterium]PIE40324.1 MAG: glycerate kinase [Gammaproteobacteria bacterium]
MKFVIAPDSFKESLSAREVATAIEQGIHHALPDAQCVCLPMADGGEGTAKALCQLHNGQWRCVHVQDPLGKDVRAGYAILPNQCAVIEMAEASGLALLTPDQRNPLLTSTHGVGEMMRDALSRGVRKFILGIGGSATNDGGSGMLTALGVKFYDADGNTLPPGGGALSSLSRVDLSGLDDRLKESEITVACDVNNPLLGDRGASAIFGPQKGADREMVGQLDRALAHYADKLVQAGFPDHRETAGSGAAGGLGFALFGLPNSTSESGIELVIRESGFSEACQDADFVITGEGRMDGQTLLGKVPAGVLRHAQKHNTAVIALCGCLGQSHEKLNDLGFSAIFPIIPFLDNLENTLKAGEVNLVRTARQIAEIIKLSQRSK